MSSQESGSNEFANEFDPTLFGLQPEFAAALEPNELRDVVGAVAKVAARLRHPDTQMGRTSHDFVGRDVRDLTAGAGWLRLQDDSEIVRLQEDWQPDYEERKRDEHQRRLEAQLGRSTELLDTMRSALIDTLASGGERRNRVAEFSGQLLVPGLTADRIHRYRLDNGTITGHDRPEVIEKERLQNAPDWIQEAYEYREGNAMIITETPQGAFVVGVNGHYRPLKADIDAKLKGEETRIHAIATGYNEKKDSYTDIHQVYSVRASRVHAGIGARLIGLISSEGDDVLRQGIPANTAMKADVRKEREKLSLLKAAEPTYVKDEDAAFGGHININQFADMIVERPDLFGRNFDDTYALKQKSDHILPVFLTPSGSGVIIDRILGFVPQEIVVAYK